MKNYIVKFNLDQQNSYTMNDGCRPNTFRMDYILNNNIIKTAKAESANRQARQAFFESAFRAGDEREFVRLRVTAYTDDEYLRFRKEYEIDITKKQKRR